MAAMVRDARTLAIYSILLLAVLGGVCAAYATGRRGLAAGRQGPAQPRPGRAIALTLAAEEIIIGLDGPGRLAAVTGLSLDRRFSNVAGEAARVGQTVSGTSVERIVRLRPELVLIAPYTDAAARSALERYGVRLLRLRDFDSVAAIREGILDIGNALGLEEKAREMVAAMDRRIQAARGRIPPGARPPRVLRFDPADAWAAGSGTVIDDAIRLAGAVNVAAENGLSGAHLVRTETVARWNPEVLVVEGEPEERPAIIERLRAEPVLEPVEAVRNAAGRGLVVLPARTLGTVSHHVAEAVERLVEELHFPVEGKKP